MKTTSDSCDALVLPSRTEEVVEDLLLRIELAGTPEERAWCQGALDGLMAVDEEAAAVVRMHRQIEGQLLLLAEHPEWWPKERVSPLGTLFRKLRARLFPGAVG